METQLFGMEPADWATSVAVQESLAAEAELPTSSKSPEPLPPASHDADGGSDQLDTTALDAVVQGMDSLQLEPQVVGGKVDDSGPVQSDLPSGNMGNTGPFPVGDPQGESEVNGDMSEAGLALTY